MMGSQLLQRLPRFGHRALVLLGLMVLGLMVFGFPAASAAELNHFEIQTSEDKHHVQVILYTDGRANYQTRESDQGFTVILNDTQLSEQNLKSGLPVVIDNQNKFIGRAVPADGNQVKIIIPNLPANQYSVSIIQKPSPQQAATTTNASVLRPRGAKTVTDKAFDNQFEAIATQFKPVQTKPRTASTRKPQVISGNSHAPYSPQPVAQQPVSPQYYFPQWNPQDSTLSTTPSARSYRPPAESYGAMAIPSEPADGEALFPQPPVEDGTSASAPGNGTTFPSPHIPQLQLDPGPITDLSNTAPAPEAEAAPETGTITASAGSEFWTGLSAGISGIPLWAVILGTLFFGGIGLFTLAGGILMMRLLFNPTLPRLVLAPEGMVMANAAAFATQPVASESPGEKDDAAELDEFLGTEPLIREEDVESDMALADVACVNASEYLIHSPNNVREAVQNAVLLKFPANRRRSRSSQGSRRMPGRR